MGKKQSGSKTPKHASQSVTKQESNASTLAIQKPHFWSMNLLPERGYEMTKASPPFLSTVAKLNWGHFVLPRTGYNEELVREFYAGISDDGPKKTYTSKVRGKIVQFHPKKINEHYMLRYNGFDFDVRVGNSHRAEMEEVRKRIATPNSVWEKFTDNEIKLRSTYLIDALGNWHLFVCTSILPTSHTYAMTKERLILLDTILSEGNVDIGKLIAREIYTCTTKTKGFLFYPCLITELCLKAAVPISPNEPTKYLSNSLKAEMKERVRRERVPVPPTTPTPMPIPVPMQTALHENFMQKQAAVWKFQKEQHDWLQLAIHYMSNEAGNIEAPVFPNWVLRTSQKEEEEETEKNDEEEGEEKDTDEEKEEKPKKKKVTRKQEKGKKKVVVEPELKETYDSDSEDLELEKEMDKETEEEEESEDEVSSEEEERAREVILEEIARQKYAKTSESAPQEKTHTSPVHSPTRKTSPPTDQTIQSPPQETPPPPKTTTEQDKTEPEQTVPPSPSNITTNVISALENEFLQEKEKEGLNKEKDHTEEQEPEEAATETVKETIEMQTDAPAPDASASQPTAAMKPTHDEATIKLVLEQMAKQKREALGNTQQFLKTPATKKLAVKAPKRKTAETVQTDATASVTASTPEEIGASAPVETTPKPKAKKQKMYTPPTRQSSRTRSGANK